MAQMRAMHLLIKHTESRNPISRRTNEQITISKAEAHEELAAVRDSIVAELEGVDDLPKRADIFGSHATRRSDCGSYRNGGDLGEFGPGAMQKGFEDGVLSIKVVGALNRLPCVLVVATTWAELSPSLSLRLPPPSPPFAGRGLGHCGQRQRVAPHHEAEVNKG